MKKIKLDIRTKEVKPEIQSDSFIGVGPCMDSISWSNYWTISPNGIPNISELNIDPGIISSIAAHPGNDTIAGNTISGFAAGYIGSVGNIKVGVALGALAGAYSCTRCHD